ncbi:1-acyl-sn-glycerol-3-phosphate acyltransferase [Nocardioides panacisoli]|uniref:lysophospholipid acyltransferase family protein n=1 Tax=Nocardioides panacisoli TaxID=627624 RepID=UPI001C625808|nr:lysophospholipid acyltransferase family protein [Nocardioides panacisoli]QYJ05133.1 1-acyl-sn-glycerol-3-phosphate acyltransferase [Nocardioides panacisoli]
MTHALPGAHRDRPRSDAVPHPRRGLLHRGRPASRWLIRRWYDVRVHNAERFPKAGPVVVAANHVGFVDGPLLAIFAPRPVHALTKEEMFVGPLGGFLRAAGQIPLQRRWVDPRAVRTSLRVLREGGAVGVFPEGSRGAGELRRFHRGAAYLGMVGGAPVVPITFLGTREPGGTSGSLPGRRARIDIVVGEPITLPATGWPRKKTEVARRSLLLRDHMLHELRRAKAETGRELPGPLSEGDFEPLPGNLLEGH